MIFNDFFLFLLHLLSKNICRLDSLSTVQRYRFCLYRFIDCNSMKQQNLKVVVRPAKSHSARSFFKLFPQNRNSPLRFKTLHTEPLEPATTFKLHQQKSDNKSYRHTARAKDISFHPPQELHQQNIKLKGKVNRLTEELVREKVKRTKDTRHYLKMQRQVELQFEDDKYLDLSRNQNKMIQGVKHQYQKMKTKYEQKCQEFNALLKRYEISQGEQQRFQCEALRVQNIKLRQKLNLLLQTQERIVEEYNKVKKSQSQSHGGVSNSSRSKQKKQEITLDLLGYASRMVEMQKSIEDLRQKNAILQARVQRLKSTISQRNNKIKFLDRLIIQKSNENHHLVMQDRKIQKETKHLASSLEEVKQRLEKQSQIHRQQMDLLKEKETIKFQTERSIFLNTLQQKDREIDKITEELKYLTTLISYIKTGDEPFQQTFNPLSKKRSDKERSQQILMNLEKSLISFEGNDVRERVKSFIQSGRKQLPNHKIQSNSEALKKVPLLSEGDDVGVSQPGSEIQADEQVMIESRMIKRSYLKHSKDCVRIKHVKIEQLEGFRLDLVYRLIYYRISSTAAKDYLTFRLTSQEESSLRKRQQRWRSRYLSMKQARSKLLMHPFELLPEQATLLARYMVEDATKEDLFYHEENEIQRSIAKSILKAFVGEYLIPDEKRARQEIKEVLSKSGKNLRSALTSLAPTGTISHFKFLEISTGINVDFSEEAQNYIISQLAFQSPGGISALLYDKLFDSL